jgi:hypothetical protein
MAKEEEYYLKNPKGNNLTERQLFGISLGLIIGEQNGLYIDSLEMGDQTSNPQKQMMQQYWNISDRETALEWLDNRSGEGGHRHLFNQLLDICIEQDCTEAKLIDFAGTAFEDSAEDVLPYLVNLEEILQLENGQDWLEGDFDVHADAWDFGRIVFVGRVCYSLGYLYEHEAWAYIDKALRMAEKIYDNWEDYATSYLLGRAMWTGDDDGGWENVMVFAADALYDKKSPWKKLNW